MKTQIYRSAHGIKAQTWISIDDCRVMTVSTSKRFSGDLVTLAIVGERSKIYNEAIITAMGAPRHEVNHGKRRVTEKLVSELHAEFLSQIDSIKEKLGVK